MKIKCGYCGKMYLLNSGKYGLCEDCMEKASKGTLSGKVDELIKAWKNLIKEIFKWKK